YCKFLICSCDSYIPNSQRRQKFVEAQNITFFSILEEALPKELWCYLKSDTIPKSKHSNMVCENNCSTLAISSPTSTVPNLTSSGNISELNRVNPIHSRDKEIHPASSVNKKNMSLNHPRTTRLVYSSTRGDNCTDLSLCSNDSSVSQECTFRLGNDEPVNNHTSVPSSLSEQRVNNISQSYNLRQISIVPSFHSKLTRRYVAHNVQEKLSLLPYNVMYSVNNEETMSNCWFVKYKNYFCVRVQFIQLRSSCNLL
uniref:Myotubularin phosphatase domain-containing protein n=1 Tax=Schistosoma curassoni TaxID=6186 RepID=A0A183KYG4_9TREM